ncbi:hypothetical protein BH23BAC1_BH23BAC1_20590 [soil metagenome]
MEFRMPPLMYNQNGEVRKAGFEIEFGDIDLDIAASCIIDVFGGIQQKENQFYRKVVNTSIGDFNLRIDTRLLTEKSYKNFFKKIGLETEEIPNKESFFEKALESIASFVVPYEIGAPPVPFTEVHVLDKLRKALYEKKAGGTTSSILYAFAIHINPELPQYDHPTILRYLRAFFLFYHWLMEELEVNFTRRITPFINPFPEEYILLVLHYGYNPDFETLMEDYHKFNPDRNRPLDLYPVFAFFNKEKVAKLPDVGKVTPRPTFHYRIPNSMIDEPDWSLARCWNSWVEIEKLASDSESLKNLCKEYLDLKDRTLIGFKNKWKKRIQNWINAQQT